MRRRRAVPLLAAAALLALLAGGPAAAAPATDPTSAARPTADTAAPTPSAPLTGPPERGTAPDGSTVGGQRLGSRGTVVADGAPPLPAGITATAWLVADASSGRVLAARDAHGRHYPASTLKTLTLLTLVPRLDPAQVVEATPEDEQVEGSRVGLVACGRYPVSLLFEALVLQSGNDAASALARVAGGQEATVAAMNRTASDLGAYDTVAGNPSGLDVAGQTTSAYDLALIFRALLEEPAAAAVLRVPTAAVPPVEGRSPGFQIQNQNPLAGYPGGLGGKTGFTDAARHTFVTGAERDGRRLVVSVLDTENVPLRAADQAALLLDWGFAVPPATPGVGRLVRPGDLLAAPAPAPAATPAPPRPGAGRTTGAATPWLLPALGGAAVLSATLLGAGSARRRRVRPAAEPPARGRRPSRRR
ncbi:D-alanyl-D-alanine carboxypeptidase [Blastococcus sp. TF02-8]|uniref:D-alanyl-D-alanine carboxypeptidase family protein n=1 Tax=Blastococcus sp. TF02-8 TaxID=2250574 RepID=UPI000DE9B63D|nr:serine hydrolase [Blastococcus sp. TF02-8]RBY93479.1 D-alanyl-D-alanine carboxypeptidase [Blastococcus sp. TF02-8]